MLLQTPIYLLQLQLILHVVRSACQLSMFVFAVQNYYSIAAAAAAVAATAYYCLLLLATACYCYCYCLLLLLLPATAVDVRLD
jgi:hypothetical protein